MLGLARHTIGLVGMVLVAFAGPGSLAAGAEALGRESHELTQGANVELESDRIDVASDWSLSGAVQLRLPETAIERVSSNEVMVLDDGAMVLQGAVRIELEQGLISTERAMLTRLAGGVAVIDMDRVTWSPE